MTMAKPVGYGNPPEHARWCKGQSGNPKGRPKRPASLADDLLAELAEIIPLTQGGKVTKITKQRAVVKALAAGAIKGDVRASNILMACLRVIEAKGDPHADPVLTIADQKIVDDYVRRQTAQRRPSIKGKS